MVQFSGHKEVRGIEKLGFSSSISPPGPVVALFDFFPEFPPSRAHIGLEWSRRSLRWELGPFEGAFMKKFELRR